MSSLELSISTEAAASIVSGPIFAAEWNEQKQLLTVHTCSRRASLTMARTGGQVAIKKHNRRVLQSPRSLEGLTGALRGGKIVYDPTQIFTRAALLVQAVKSVRARFATEVAGYYFDAASRAVLVLQRPGVTGQRSGALRSEVAAAMAQAAPSGELPAMPVRVVDALPQFGSCVAVDAASSRAFGHWKTILRGAAASAIFSGLLFGTAAHAKISPDLGPLAGLSVFAEGQARSGADAFTATGMTFFFGEDGARSRIEVQLAQGGPGDSGLRIVVNPEKQVEDGPELRRPVWQTPPAPGGGGAPSVGPGAAATASS
jgi:hypothetical protein